MSKFDILLDRLESSVLKLDDKFHQNKNEINSLCTKVEEFKNEDNRFDSIKNELDIIINDFQNIVDKNS